VKLALIVPRYGEDIVGGAETAARQFAEHLPTAEFDVEVLTTCTNDLQSGRNIYPAGTARVNGIQVTRFPIDRGIRNEKRYWELMIKFTHRWLTTVDDEYEWIEHSVHSPALYAHLLQHGRSYDYLIFIPYLFGTTFYGSTLYPERTILWPCLHDEPFARFFQTRLMLEACRGVMFNSPPEMDLALGKLGVHNRGAHVVGCGLEEYQADATRFRRTSGLTDPFILYAGRLDSMKNLIELFAFFTEYKLRMSDTLKLVLIGGGSLPVPKHPDIVLLGYQTNQAKLDAFAAATLLCQPSLMESFSIVLMEAWLAGTAVLVHGDCDVTREHVLRSNGGLYYSTFDEFAGAVNWLLSHPGERTSMGQSGRAYVLQEHSWQTVLGRFRNALAVWGNP
jgi:glycosyltransferase involved in cell wall biosynthesis